MTKTQTSMDKKHTPIPWEAIGNALIRDAVKAKTDGGIEGGKIIAACGPLISLNEWDECQANANLIVNCVNCHDELLEALVLARGEVTNADVCTFIDAAIAKARGGQK